MDTLNQRIRERRLALGMTLSELGAKIGVRDATIQRYESGEIKNIKRETVARLAQALDTTPSYLMGWDGPQEALSQSFDVTPVAQDDFAMIPVVGDVSAGLGCLAEQRFDEYEAVYLPDLKGSDLSEYFFLKIKGDSMSPVFVADDLALIRRQTSVDSGSYAVALIDGTESVLKKLVYGPSWLELQSVNPMYAVRRFEGEELRRVEVVGIVRQVKRFF